MTKTITVQIRTVYGVDTIYPACPTSAFFAALAGTRTLTAEKLRLIRAAGYGARRRGADAAVRRLTHRAAPMGRRFKE